MARNRWKLPKRRLMSRWSLALAPLLGAVVALVSLSPSAIARTGGMRSANLGSVPAQPLTGERRAAFDAYIASAMNQFGVPGASVAVVQDGQVVYLQGFGVKELGKNAAVGPDSLFAISSTTKAFTSAMAATVVDDGLMTWDTPVGTPLPDFAVADSTLTPRITVADSFCMCTGVPTRNWQTIFNAKSLTANSLIASVARMPLTAPFGEVFQYNNQMYATGGYAATRAAGGTPNNLNLAYQRAMRDRLLDPLGMMHSTFTIDDVLAGGDYADPHATDLEGHTQPISLLATARTAERGAGPSGALWSNARDMTRWLQMQLAHGVGPDGTRVISDANLQRTRAPRVPIPSEPSAPDLVNDASRNYAMGWEVGVYEGQALVHHSGSVLGYNSQVSLLPDAGVGVVILTNGGLGARQFTVAVRFRLLELLFNQPEEYDSIAVQSLQSDLSDYSALRAQLRPVDPVAVSPYVGRYTNDAMGDVVLSLYDGNFVFDTGTFRSELWEQVDGAGRVMGYAFIDPPLAQPGLPITFRLNDAGRPEMVITAVGEISDAEDPGAVPSTT
jgi:CubicO group peptidase (beta-lactamase class C family)